MLLAKLTLTLLCLLVIPTVGVCEKMPIESEHAGILSKSEETSTQRKIREVRASLDKIYAVYMSLPKTSQGADRLYALHLQATQVAEEIQKLDFGLQLDDEKYISLGFYYHHFAEQTEYSQKLLADLYLLYPDSKYREEAWYAWLNRGTEYGGHGQASIELLKAYLNEFPSGKYASGAYSKLGDFYYGLYKYLKYGESENSDSLSCYRDHISSAPIAEQMSNAQKIGLELYSDALLHSSDEREKSFIRNVMLELKAGVMPGADYWCDMDD
jgi:hypothetical protein